MKGKLTILDLREKYGVDILSLADNSDVEPSIVYCMLLNRPVSYSDALQVLSGLRRLVGINYVLDDVDVALLKE